MILPNQRVDQHWSAIHCPCKERPLAHACLPLEGVHLLWDQQPRRGKGVGGGFSRTQRQWASSLFGRMTFARSFSRNFMPLERLQLAFLSIGLKGSASFGIKLRASRGRGLKALVCTDEAFVRAAYLSQTRALDFSCSPLEALMSPRQQHVLPTCRRPLSAGAVVEPNFRFFFLGASPLR